MTDYHGIRLLLISLLPLFMAIMCQGCIGSTFKADPDGQLLKDFGNLNSVPDAPPRPDLLKYQQMRQELLSAQ